MVRAQWWLVALVIIGITVAGCGVVPTAGEPDGDHSSTPASSRTATSPSPTAPKSPPTGTSSPRTSKRDQLPRGGTTIFPRYRVVAYYGTPGTSRLGVLGSQPPKKITGKVAKTAAPFATSDRKAQPAPELIVTVADSNGGHNHRFRHNIAMSQARRYLKAARAHHELLILDIQPGDGSFLPLVKHWSKLLAEPDVGLALDSEWHMHDGQTPGRVIGHSDAGDINTVSRWLERLVRRRRLPDKLFVLHQFTKHMLRHPGRIKNRRGLATVQHLDGFGNRADKLAKYRGLQRPHQFHPGFKLFYRQDQNLMPPKRVLNLKPPPEYVSYQ